jgi:hypothetical protein
MSDIMSLSLETSILFQEDNMFYGFFIDRKNCSVFIYSKLREGIALKYKDVDYRFPEFIPALLINIGLEDIVFKWNSE